MKTKILLPFHQKPANPFQFIVILLTIALLVSGSALIPQSEIPNSNNLRDKKLDLLDNLEKGNFVRSEDIQSSFSHDYDTTNAYWPFSQEFNEMFDNLRLEINDFQFQVGNFCNSDKIDHAMEHLRKEMEKLRTDLESICNEIRLLRDI